MVESPSQGVSTAPSEGQHTGDRTKSWEGGRVQNCRVRLGPKPWLSLAVFSWLSWLSAWASAVRSFESVRGQEHPVGTSLCSKCLHLSSEMDPIGPTPQTSQSRLGDEGRSLGWRITVPRPPPSSSALAQFLPDDSNLHPHSTWLTLL